MPHKACTHDENRQKVCFLCFKKQNKMFVIKNTLKSHMEKLVDNYVDDERFPASLCNSCKRNIYRAASGEMEIKSPDLSIFQPLKKSTRLNNNVNCDCKVCEIGRSQPINISNKTPKNTVSGKIKKLEKNY